MWPLPALTFSRVQTHFLSLRLEFKRIQEGLDLSENDVRYLSSETSSWHERLSNHSKKSDMLLCTIPWLCNSMNADRHSITNSNKLLRSTSNAFLYRLVSERLMHDVYIRLKFVIFELICNINVHQRLETAKVLHNKLLLNKVYMCFLLLLHYALMQR